MTVNIPPKDRVKILNSEDLYVIMRDVLMREQKIDQDKEHFWVIGLANNNRLLFIELVSLGTVNKTLVEPMEVFSIALQKRAVKIMLVHNHPSGELRASEGDKDKTDRLIQVGLIVDCHVIDHLIITPTSYVSFEDIGLMEMLRQSKKYVPRYKEVDRIKAEAMKIGKELGLKEGLAEGEMKGRKEGLKEGKLEIAKSMLATGKYTLKEIATITGLSQKVLKELA